MDLKYKTKKIWAAFFVVLFLFSAFGPSISAAGRATTHISFGSHQISDGEVTLSGEKISIGVDAHISDNWGYFVSLSAGSTTGESEDEKGNEISLESRDTTLNGGCHWRASMGKGVKLTPYIGGGLSLQSYYYDLRYPKGNIGETSGFGYGPLLYVGLNINLNRSFIVTPNYQYSQIYIKAEDGDLRSVSSSGFHLNFALRF